MLFVSMLMFHSISDVDDVARVNVKALSPNISDNERYIFHSPEILVGKTAVLAIREALPQLREHVSASEEGASSGRPSNLVKADIVQI